MSTHMRNIPQLKARLRALQRATRDSVLNKAAYAGGLVVQRKCMQNIREAPSPKGKMGLIDTGFMVNSVYTVAPGHTGDYMKATAQATARNPEEEMLPPAEPMRHQAIVTVGAEYFRHWEEGTSTHDPVPTLVPAVDQTEKDIVKAVCSVIEKEVERVCKWPT